MAATIPGYEYDIFISYRQNDNHDAWVTKFVEALDKELKATLKNEVSIYFDENPHDGLHEHHEVDASLREKLKCLILIPVVSQTFCDPKSFAWEHEFKVFVEQAGRDQFGLKVKLPGGNVANRVLAIRIHDLDNKDVGLFEAEIGSVMRSIDFIYQETGVNRPLRANEENPSANQNHTFYLNQVNKVANAIKGIISGMQSGEEIPSTEESTELKKDPSITPSDPRAKRKLKFKLPSINRAIGSRLTIIGMLFALIVLAFIHFSEPIPNNPTYRSTILPPENMSFSVDRGGHIALSPDGCMLAFVARDSLGKNLLWVRPLDAISGQALSGTEGARYPFWSPDSRFIGFFADGKLKKIEASGGPSQTLCDAPIGRGGSWNQEGTIVFCPSVGSPLFSVNEAGGLPSSITQLISSRSDGSHRWPSFLPDGKHFLFTIRSGGAVGGENDAIYLASLDSSFVPRVLINSSSSVDYANGHILFAREQTLLAQPFNASSLQTTGGAFPIAEGVYYESLTNKTSFSVSQNGILLYQTRSNSSGASLNWYDRKGKKEATISQSSLVFDISLSPDGKRIAASRSQNRNIDIWIYEISRAVWTRFTFDPARERWPNWSPDGSTIVFASDRNKGWNLFQQISSGAGREELLLEPDLQKRQSNWSRDGKFIAYNADNSKNGWDIWILPMNPNTQEASGDGKPYLFLQTTFDEYRPVFSPDGRWIAYQSDESGSQEIYIRPFPGPRGKWQVSTNGGTRPRWRGDGKELFYLDADAFITVAETNLGSSTVEIGLVRPLFSFIRYTGGTDNYDVTADGQHFLVIEAAGDATSSPITMVVNWLGQVEEE